MKKYLLLFLLCVSWNSLFAQYSDKTKEITATIGVPFTITPYADLGIPLNWYKSCSDVDDNWNSYTISDSNAFSITNQNYNIGSSYQPIIYYIYNLSFGSS